MKIGIRNTKFLDVNFNKRLIHTQYIFIAKYLLLCCFLNGTMIAQTKLSLAQAVKKGLQNSFDVQISELEYIIANNKSKSVKKEYLPKINTYLQQTNTFVNDRSPTTFINDFYRDHYWDIGLDGAWMVFDGFRARFDSKIHKKLSEEKLSTKKLVIDNTIHAIILAYYNALIKKEATKIANETYNLSYERLQQAQLQLELGKMSTYDVLKFENALLADSILFMTQSHDLNQAIKTLNTAMGNTKTINYTLSDQLIYKTKNFQTAALNKKISQSNQQLRNHYLNLELLQLNTQSKEQSLLPTIRINSGVNQRFSQTSFPELPKIKSRNFNYYLQFSVNYNLFDGGSTKRQIEENKIQEKIANLQLNQVRIQLKDELDKFIANYQQQLSIIAINKRLIGNLKKSLTLEKDRFEKGYSSPLHYRTLQMEYLQVQYNQLTAIYDLLTNELEILKLTGQRMY